MHINTIARCAGLAASAAAIAAIAAASAPAGAATATPATWTLSSGASYSKGDYGDVAATKVLAVPVSLTYRKGGLKLRATLPWVTISGPGSLIQTPEGRDVGGGGDDGGGDDSGSNSGPGSSNSGSGGGSGGGDVEGCDDNSGPGSGDDNGGDCTGGGSGGGRSDRRSGIGDLSLAAVYSFDLGNGLYLDPGIKLKIPTASRSKRIGTGKADVTASLDLAKEFGNATLYVAGRRRFTGKPTGSNLRSTWGAGAGASLRASRTLLIGADYDWQQASIRGNGPSSEGTLWGSVRVTDRARLTLSGTKGFTKNSADYAAAAIVSWRL